MTRPDSDLELTSLKYNMAANYSCVVSLTDGTKGTAEDEVLIVGKKKLLRNMHCFFYSSSGQRERLVAQ